MALRTLLVLGAARAADAQTGFVGRHIDWKTQPKPREDGLPHVLMPEEAPGRKRRLTADQEPFHPRAAVGKRRLHPQEYVEPEQAFYYTGEFDPVLPTDAPRLDSKKDLDRERFDNFIRDGLVFVVPGFTDDWPMKEWNCDFFHSDPEFRNFNMTSQGADGIERVALHSDWLHRTKPSGAAGKDSGEAPPYAPYYFGVQDMTSKDASVLKRVANAMRLPEFMAKENLEEIQRTLGFWLGGNGTRVKAQMHSAVQTLVAVQLSGTKQFRIRFMDQRTAPYLTKLYGDGQVYDHARPDGSILPKPWNPIFRVELKQGEALFIPPGMIYETKTLGDECAAAVNLHFSRPMPVRLFRTYFPRLRRTADAREAWPLIEMWASLNWSSKGKEFDFYRGMPFSAGLHRSLELVDIVDADHDGVVSLREFRTMLRPEFADAAHTWHDWNADGDVTAEELQNGFAYWVSNTWEVMGTTKKGWKEYQHGAHRGGPKIEDASQTDQERMYQWSSFQERSWVYSIPVEL